MRTNGLRVDIVIRDPISGKVYKKRDSPIENGIKDMYSFIATKYQGEKKRTATVINNDMSRRT